MEYLETGNISYAVSTKFLLQGENFRLQQTLGILYQYDRVMTGDLISEKFAELCLLSGHRIGCRLFLLMLNLQGWVGNAGVYQIS